MTKATLRIRMRALRDAIPAPERAALSAAACQRLLDLPALRDAAVIFTYVSHGSELDTHALIRAWLGEGRTVAVPHITGRGTMQASAITSFEELMSGPYGILAPREARPLSQPIGVAIVPGLAFTPSGCRLGAGAGCYDRFFAAQPVATRVGLCLECQIVAALPADPHDQPMTHVVTDQRVLTCP
jgi:5-formyltetrahydrofolate cyclo-ligase